MQLNEVYCLSDGIRAREEEFGLLVVAKSIPALSLNKDMKVVWDLIDGKNTCADIIAAVKNKYPTSNNVEAKITKIFDLLSKLNLIKIV